MIPSIASGSATPSSSAKIASLIMGHRILFETKPGESLQAKGTLPICSLAFTTNSVTSEDVSLPLMISTNFITGTGFMKCIPITLSGRLVASAIALMEILEVLLASIASGLQIVSNSANVENFSSGISGIASTTKSASAADVFSVEVEIREIA